MKVLLGDGQRRLQRTRHVVVLAGADLGLGGPRRLLEDGDAVPVFEAEVDKVDGCGLQQEVPFDPESSDLVVPLAHQVEESRVARDVRHVDLAQGLARIARVEAELEEPGGSSR